MTLFCYMALSSTLWWCFVAIWVILCLCRHIPVCFVSSRRRLYCGNIVLFFFFFQAEDGIRDLVRSRGLGDMYKGQLLSLHSNLFIMLHSVSYTHLTLPTKRIVEISVVAVPLKKKKKKNLCGALWCHNHYQTQTSTYVHHISEPDSILQYNHTHNRQHHYTTIQTKPQL